MAKVKAQLMPTSAKDLPKEVYDEIRAYINSLPTKKGAVIHVLHKAQSLIGYLPKEVMLFIASELNIPASEVFGVVSFYSYFSTNPTGKCKISVCMGTACFVKGSQEVLKAFEEELGIKSGETTSDGLFTLQDVRCVGACGLAPILTADNKVYGHVTKEQIKKIISEQKEIIENASK